MRSQRLLPRPMLWKVYYFDKIIWKVYKFSVVSEALCLLDKHYSNLTFMLATQFFDQFMDFSNLSDFFVALSINLICYYSFGLICWFILVFVGFFINKN